jgi:hypothetical protein
VFVNDAATSVIAGTAARVPYAAPEVIDGQAATPLSDQYSLAAIAYEWLFGRPVSHNGDRPIEVRAMPGVDRLALSRAFTRALAQKPGDRFASCGAFCDALAGAVGARIAFARQHRQPKPPALVAAAAEADAADVDDFAPEDPSAEPPIVAADLAESPVLNVDDIKIVAEESILTAAQPDLDAIAPPFDPPPAAVTATAAAGCRSAVLGPSGPVGNAPATGVAAFRSVRPFLRPDSRRRVRIRSGLYGASEGASVPAATDHGQSRCLSCLDCPRCFRRGTQGTCSAGT